MNKKRITNTKSQRENDMAHQDIKDSARVLFDHPADYMFSEKELAELLTAVAKEQREECAENAIKWTARITGVDNGEDVICHANKIRSAPLVVEE